MLACTGYALAGSIGAGSGSGEITGVMGEGAIGGVSRLGRRCVGIAFCRAICKARAKCVIVGKRSFGAIARALKTTCSIWGDTSGRTLLRGGGVSF